MSLTYLTFLYVRFNYPRVSRNMMQLMLLVKGSAKSYLHRHLLYPSFIFVSFLKSHELPARSLHVIAQRKTVPWSLCQQLSTDCSVLSQIAVDPYTLSFQLYTLLWKIFFIACATVHIPRRYMSPTMILKRLVSWYN